MFKEKTNFGTKSTRNKIKFAFVVSVLVVLGERVVEDDGKGWKEVDEAVEEVADLCTVGVVDGACFGENEGRGWREVEGRGWRKVDEAFEEVADVCVGDVDELGDEKGLTQSDGNFGKLLQFRCCGQGRLMQS